MWNKLKSLILNNQKGYTGYIRVIILLLVVTLIFAILPQIEVGISISSTEAATNYLEARGYVVLSSVEYDTINNDLNILLGHIHTKQYVAPVDDAILLQSGAGAFNLGDYSAEFLSTGNTTGRFEIVGIGFGQPSANAIYTIYLYGGTTEIGQVSFDRQGIILSSIYRPMTTELMPAGTVIRAKMKDSVGSGTCICKIYYHYN